MPLTNARLKVEENLHLIAHNSYDHAVAQFRANPTAANWRPLMEAILVMQAWANRFSAEANARQGYGDWLDRMGQISVADAQAEIFRRAHGSELSSFDLF